MAYSRLPMHKTRDVLRLRYGARRSKREIARSLRLARSTIADCLKRAHRAGLTWPLPLDITDGDLEARLYPAPEKEQKRPLPDFKYVYDELRAHRNVNLTLWQLWVEYKEVHPTGYQYTQFCRHYRRWRGKLDYVMRQEHRAGEKLFVDYTKGPDIVDRETGELTPTALFVAAWGFSNYTYTEASLTQTVPHWTKSHVRAFDYFGCCPRVLTPDCLKSGVIKPCFYEPDINRAYAELAEHYGSVVLPARPVHPRDKAVVENGVLVSKRWILAVLRHRTFFSLDELNTAIRELLEVLNTRPMRKIKKSRRDLFEAQDRPAAQPLPDGRYEYAEWVTARVNINYYIQVRKHYYSAPFQLIHEKLDARVTATTVELFQKGERIHAHVRSYKEWGYTRHDAHMPPEHQKYAEWTPSRMIGWADETGPTTGVLVRQIFANHKHPEQAYRSCLGILKHLVKHYGRERVEAAAKRALQFNLASYKSMRSILCRGLDRQTEPGKTARQSFLPFHENVRGGGYYH